MAISKIVADHVAGYYVASSQLIIKFIQSPYYTMHPTTILDKQ